MDRWGPQSELPCEAILAPRGGRLQHFAEGAPASFWGWLWWLWWLRRQACRRRLWWRGRVRRQACWGWLRWWLPKHSKSLCRAALVLFSQTSSTLPHHAPQPPPLPHMLRYHCVTIVCLGVGATAEIDARWCSVALSSAPPAITTSSSVALLRVTTAVEVAVAVGTAATWASFAILTARGGEWIRLL